MILRKKGFTLVEMLVVIAIIAILAAALFPAIQNAINTAKASAVKNRGRGVWVGIVSANSEREPLNRTTLWPASDASSEITGANPPNSVPWGTNNATKYFQSLMACDASTLKPQTDPSMRYVTDLNPNLLGGLEWPLDPAGALGAANNMWIVANISDSSPSEDAFLISRNVMIGEPASTSGNDYDIHTAVINVASNSFFGLREAQGSSLSKTRGMFVTRGGGCFDLKKLYLQGSKIFVSTNVYSLLPAKY